MAVDYYPDHLILPCYFGDLAFDKGQICPLYNSLTTTVSHKILENKI